MQPERCLSIVLDWTRSEVKTSAENVRTALYSLYA